jgi:hypothetical protein
MSVEKLSQSVPQVDNNESAKEDTNRYAKEVIVPIKMEEFLELTEQQQQKLITDKLVSDLGLQGLENLGTVLNTKVYINSDRDGDNIKIQYLLKPTGLKNDTFLKTTKKEFEGRQYVEMQGILNLNLNVKKIKKTDELSNIRTQKATNLENMNKAQTRLDLLKQREEALQNS